MRTLLHIAAILLALPQVLLATAFLILGHMTGGHSIGSFFTRSLDVLAAFFGWAGLLALATLVALLVAGFFPDARRIAAGVVAALVIGSTVALFVRVHVTFDDAWIFLPGLLALTASGWLIATRGVQ